MIFHENRLLADDSHEISPYLFRNFGNLSSAAVVIGALRVNYGRKTIVCTYKYHVITCPNSLETSKNKE